MYRGPNFWEFFIAVFFGRWIWGGLKLLAFVLFIKVLFEVGQPASAPVGAGQGVVQSTGAE